MRPRCVTIEQFLPPEAGPSLLQFAAEQENAFVPSSAGEGWPKTRASLVLFETGPWAEAIGAQVHRHRHWVMDRLGVPPFEVAQTEVQLTHSGEAAYFHGHNDNGSPDTANRVLTFVYYAFREPAAFRGGDLVLYAEPDWQRWRVQPGEGQRIPPVANTIVFFPSAVIHAVEPVTVASGAFLDGRFTLNGWLRRQG